MSFMSNVSISEFAERINSLIVQINPYCTEYDDCSGCPFNDTFHTDCLVSMCMALHHPKHADKYFEANRTIERFKNTPSDDLDKWLTVIYDHVNCDAANCCYTCPVWFGECLCEALRREHGRLNNGRSC